MARVTNEGISGAVGGLVFYTLNGMNYVKARSGRRRRKRGQAADPLQTLFGTVSTYSSAMVKRMKPQFLFPVKPATYNQLRGWMRILYALEHLEPVWDLAVNSGMCQLNPVIDLRDFLKIQLTVSDRGNGVIGVNFPPMNPVRNLKAPSQTVKVNLKLIAISSPFGTRSASMGFAIQEYRFDYTNTLLPAREFVLEPSAIAGDIAIVVLAMEYETAGTGRCLTDPAWLPAAVVAIGRLKN